MSGDALVMQGRVLEEQRGGLYRVEVDVGGRPQIVLARVSGRLHVHRIRVVIGDEVELEVSPYDTTRGRITYRGRREARSE